MTDTARTYAAMQALFANNHSGDISPQDLRDFVESVANPVVGGGFDPGNQYFSLYANVNLTVNDETKTLVWDGFSGATSEDLSSTLLSAGSITDLPIATWLLTFHILSLNNSDSFPGSVPTYMRVGLPGNGPGSGDYSLVPATHMSFTTVYHNFEGTLVTPFPVNITTTGNTHWFSRLIGIKLL